MEQEEALAIAEKVILDHLSWDEAKHRTLEDRTEAGGSPGHAVTDPHELWLRKIDAAVNDREGEKHGVEKTTAEDL